MAPTDTSITAIIITNPDWFQSSHHLQGCLRSLDWCNQILLLVSRITPELKQLAKEYHAQIEVQTGTNFSEWRTEAIQYCQYNWLLYVDTDERVTPELRSEIRDTISNPKHLAGYAIPRTNYILGHPMKYAGWWPDYVLRLIYKPNLLGYSGDVHEQPQIKGKTGHLTQPFLHYKHDNLEDMVTKTDHWSDTEAQLFFEANHPHMTRRRFIRPFMTEIIRRLILKRGLQDGVPGLIDGIYQGFSRFITYTKLWEKQLNNQKHP